MQNRREKKQQRRAAKQGRREQRLADRTLRPTKTAGEVFMSCRATYHDQWCSAMNGVWLAGSNKIEVVPRDCAGVEDAEPCLLCQKIEADALERARLDSADARYA